MIKHYEEDEYLHQAPEELIAQVEQVAQKLAFDKDYQVMIPKEMGLQVNPWNRMVAYGINPKNNLPFLLINPEWFFRLNSDQQEFILARNFTMLSQGTKSTAMKVLPWLWMAVTGALMVITYLALNMSPFGSNPAWMKIVMILILYSLANIIFLNSAFFYYNTQLARSHDNQIIHLALKKTGQDKQVATSTFQAMDDFVKNELAEGDAFWKPFENIFSDIIARLK